MQSSDPATVSPGREAQAPSDPTRSVRDVPLNFWFGPKKIATAKLHVEVENWPVDPLRETIHEKPDLLELPSGVAGIYRQSEPLSAVGPALKISASGIRYVEDLYARRFINLSMDFDTYLSKLSGKTRSTLRRKIRKFRAASGGTIDWRVYRRETEIDEFHALARIIAELTYQEKLFDAGIPDDQAFIDRMRELANANALRGYVLFLDQKPISYLYCPIEDDRVIYGYLGFDPTYAKVSPGTVLHLLAVEHLMSEKCYRFFDFTEGDGAHKRLFSTEHRLCANVFYLRLGVRNLAIICLHLAIRKFTDLADGLIKRVGLKIYFRQFIRGQR